ncbi:leucine-rich repeat domain-containing protein [Porphyromonas endodontalis]|nr:leucine-rich repeat domain-containing protein [Porphyromonas endodontalis]UBH64333.1 leucine-rich repeat domain-containing protein [Porphyromonas endodontalis]SUB67377.1 Internalin-J precursor [Porphyromonas endodontalis]
MKFRIVTLISLLAFMGALLPNHANAQGQKQQVIRFKTQVKPNSDERINLVMTPKVGEKGVQIDGCELVKLDKGEAWKVTKSWITITGPVTQFDCNLSAIDSITFENPESLQELIVETNKMSVLNLTGMKSLTYLGASATDIREINLTGCTSLKQIQCNGSKLVKINLTAATNLEKASLTLSSLSELDLTGLTKLKELDLNNNGISKIDLKNLPALESVVLSYNPIDAVSFSSCPKLEVISIKNKRKDSRLTSFTAVGLPALKVLNLYGNKISTLKLEDLPKLSQVNLENNSLTAVDFSKCAKSLSEVGLGNNKFSGEFELKGLENLSEFSIENNKLTSFKVTGCPALETLKVQKNELTSLDLTACSGDLSTVYASENQLSSVKLKNHKNLYLNDNKLTSVDLSSCTNLETLEMGNNKLTSLDLKGLNALSEVNVYKNNIQGDNMKKLIASLTDKKESISAGSLYAVQTRAPEEQNLCTSEHVKQAKEKKWNILDHRTYANYPGAILRTIKCRTEGNGGSIKLNNQNNTSIQAYTDTRVDVTITPDAGYGLKTLGFTPAEEGATTEDLFKDSTFWVSKDGEVVATFTNDICKVKLKRIGHGVLKLKGERLNQDLERLPRGLKVEVIANIDSNETDGERELQSLKANGENIKGTKEFVLDKDTEVVAKFEWLLSTKDPYEGETWESTFTKQVTRDDANVVLFPNPARGEVFVEGASKEATIDLYTLDGVRILSSIADPSGRAALNVAGLAEGIYVVLVGNVSKRLIVRH